MSKELLEFAKKNSRPAKSSRIPDEAGNVQVEKKRRGSLADNNPNRGNWDALRDKAEDRKKMEAERAQRLDAVRQEIRTSKDEAETLRERAEEYEGTEPVSESGLEIGADPKSLEKWLKRVSKEEQLRRAGEHPDQTGNRVIGVKPKKKGFFGRLFGGKDVA